MLSSRWSRRAALARSVFCAGLLIALVGCSAPPPAGSADGPSSDPAPAPEGNFVLYVSNQSFDIESVDIVVEIDGVRVVDDVFAVESQHNWKQYVIDLAPGTHTLTARSAEGDATFEQSFEVTGDHWAVIDYWYVTEERGTPTPRQFVFHIQDEPIGFL